MMRIAFANGGKHHAFFLGSQKANAGIALSQTDIGWKPCNLTAPLRLPQQAIKCGKLAIDGGVAIADTAKMIHQSVYKLVVIGRDFSQPHELVNLVNEGVAIFLVPPVFPQRAGMLKPQLRRQWCIGRFRSECG
ncbi:hypothetical protein [Hoeflea sp.]|uniref:hypothetical protein n=1 Tax=Hoeflea sp. TaxID=1940281 RepID=UPI003A948558